MLVAADTVLADGPLCESVESIASSADLVVRGTVGPTVGSADSVGPSGAIREIEVLEVLAGDAPAELRVAFGLGDTAGERCAPVVAGREVVLFLAAAVGTDTDATHFVVGSHNNGVMTVDDDQALVHAWVPGRLREFEPPRDDLPEDGGFPPVSPSAWTTSGTSSTTQHDGHGLTSDSKADGGWVTRALAPGSLRRPGPSRRCDLSRPEARHPAAACWR